MIIIIIMIMIIISHMPMFWSDSVIDFSAGL